MDEDTVIGRLAVTPEQLVGYAYAGLLASLITAYVEPELIHKLVKALGGVLASLAAIGIGIGIYVLYFNVIGEFFIYPLQHLFHRAFDALRGKPPERCSSCVAYLGHIGVRFGQRRASYEAIKASYFPDETRRRIQLAHGELHVLYLTAVESFAAALYQATRSRSPVIWLWSASIVFAAALVADTRQHAIEASMLRARPRTELKQFLAAGGYVADDIGCGSGQDPAA